jgi:transposase
MSDTRRFHLTDAEKDALLAEQSALIDRMASRISELESLLGRPKKTPQNSSIPPSQGGPGQKKSTSHPKPRRARPSRPGSGRFLADAPTRTERRMADVCPHCSAAVSDATQHCRQRYDHIDIPAIAPVVTRIEIFGGRCTGCRRRYRAPAPAAMPLGTPFGPGIRALLAYLHHSHHVGFERLWRMLKELFGLSISEGAIANAFQRMETGFDAACAAIKAKLREASVIASDETTTRINGDTHWQWVFVSENAILHEIAPSRGRHIASNILGSHRPAIWVSDRYAGQQELGDNHQVCLAHVLRDVQYAIDCGDTVCAPKIRDMLRWTIRIGKRRPFIKDQTLATYAAQAECRLSKLLGNPAAHPAGRELQKQIKAWRTKFFVFLRDRRVPPTNNHCEREIRPSVVFRKVTNGFRSKWGPKIHAGYRSVTSTARIRGVSALQAVRQLIDGTFAIA